MDSFHQMHTYCRKIYFVCVILTLSQLTNIKMLTIVINDYNFDFMLKYLQRHTIINISDIYRHARIIKLYKIEI